MTPSELKAIKSRITPTICETWRGDHDGSGNMICAKEGRISDDDFMLLCAAVEAGITMQERAASLHETVNAASEDERTNRVPGCGAMGAVIEYRDAIRKL